MYLAESAQLMFHQLRFHQSNRFVRRCVLSDISLGTKSDLIENIRRYVPVK